MKGNTKLSGNHKFLYKFILYTYWFFFWNRSNKSHLEGQRNAQNFKGKMFKKK